MENDDETKKLNKPAKASDAKFFQGIFYKFKNDFKKMMIIF